MFSILSTILLCLFLSLCVPLCVCPLPPNRSNTSSFSVSIFSCHRSVHFIPGNKTDISLGVKQYIIWWTYMVCPEANINLSWVTGSSLRTYVFCKGLYYFIVRTFLWKVYSFRSQTDWESGFLSTLYLIVCSLARCVNGLKYITFRFMNLIPSAGFMILIDLLGFLFVCFCILL